MKFLRPSQKRANYWFRLKGSRLAKGNLYWRFVKDAQVIFWTVMKVWNITLKMLILEILSWGTHIIISEETAVCIIFDILESIIWLGISQTLCIIPSFCTYFYIVYWFLSLRSTNGSFVKLFITFHSAVPWQHST